MLELGAVDSEEITQGADLVSCGSTGGQGYVSNLVLFKNLTQSMLFSTL